MKKLLLLSMILFVISGCKKEPPAQPGSTTPAKTCQQSTWKYEIVLANPVSAGTFQIAYLDEYVNTIIDTTITSTWSKTLGTMFSSTPTFSLHIAAGLHFWNYVPVNTPVTNNITLNIYRDGTIVQTTGVPINFCQANGSSNCGAGTVNYISKGCNCI